MVRMACPIQAYGVLLNSEGHGVYMSVFFRLNCPAQVSFLRRPFFISWYSEVLFEVQSEAAGIDIP